MQVEREMWEESEKGRWTACRAGRAWTCLWTQSRQGSLEKEEPSEAPEKAEPREEGRSS